MKPRFMKNKFDFTDIYPLEDRLVNNFGNIQKDFMERTFISKYDLMEHIQAIKDGDTGNIFFANTQGLLLLKDPNHTSNNVIPNYFIFTPKYPDQLNETDSNHFRTGVYSSTANHLDSLFNGKILGKLPKEVFFKEENLSIQWQNYHIFSR